MCVCTHTHNYVSQESAHLENSQLHKLVFCCILALNITDCVLSLGRSWPWLIDGAVVVIECVSPAVKGGQTRHTVLYIECVFVPALDVGLKASLKDPL